MKRLSVPEKLSILISSVMALLYIGGGIFLISSSLSFGYLEAGSTGRTALAGALMVYGCYRAYRVWNSLSN